MQAHDWQAYQELLAKQKGPEGASERYEVINRFLDDTEDYLHKLAGKVASVKLTQEASEAAATAMAEARAQVHASPMCLGSLSPLPPPLLLHRGVCDLLLLLHLLSDSSGALCEVLSDQGPSQGIPFPNLARCILPVFTY